MLPAESTSSCPIPCINLLRNLLMAECGMQSAMQQHDTIQVQHLISNASRMKKSSTTGARCSFADCTALCVVTAVHPEPRPSPECADLPDCIDLTRYWPEGSNMKKKSAQLFDGTEQDADLDNVRLTVNDDFARKLQVRVSDAAYRTTILPGWSQCSGNELVHYVAA